MPSSTSVAATPRLLLRVPAKRRQQRYVGGGGGGGSCATRLSPTGQQRRGWLARLRRALEQDLFVLHYQPIVSLADGAISHHEALLRLADRPDGRLTAPAHFLGTAERAGLIREIDRMVLAKVLSLLAGHEDAHTVVAVNLSALSVTDPGMRAHVQRLLAAHRVDPRRLVIELTETWAISDMRRARDFCREIEQLGCAIALDDFGAGFGSFQYLKRLPFSYLKIDGDFIHGLAGSRTDQLLVRALAELVAGMGQRTIAEFVGDGATLQLLHAYGVHYAQGFHVGRPQPRLAAARGAPPGSHAR
jgi:EAL domain-containing protein (putative c-di-GMP-specific phosphodiesterase class I)